MATRLEVLAGRGREPGVKKLGPSVHLLIEWCKGEDSLQQLVVAFLKLAPADCKKFFEIVAENMEYDKILAFCESMLDAGANAKKSDRFLTDRGFMLAGELVRFENPCAEAVLATVMAYAKKGKTFNKTTVESFTKNFVESCGDGIVDKLLDVEWGSGKGKELFKELCSRVDMGVAVKQKPSSSPNVVEVPADVLGEIMRKLDTVELKVDCLAQKVLSGQKNTEAPVSAGTISENNELSSLKSGLSRSLKIEYTDFLSYGNTEYSQNMFEVFRGSLTRIFRVLKRFEIISDEGVTK